MPDTKNNGGPAFPVPGLMDDESFNGMTLRDYFAANAMQAYFTDPNVGFGSDVLEAGAQAAYRIADAMLKARGVQ